MDNNQNNNQEPTIITAKIVGKPQTTQPVVTSSTDVNNNGPVIQELPVVNAPVEPVEVNTVSPTVQELPDVTQEVTVNELKDVDTSFNQSDLKLINPTDVKIEENVTPAPVVEQVASEEVNNQVNVDPNSEVIDEKLKKVEINYTPPSKFKTFILIVFFIVLIGFVIFLPDITTYINKLKSGDLNYQEEKITTGQLLCTLNTNTTKVDKKYELLFRYTNSKLEKTEFTITTRGDISLDEEVLNGLAATCKQLKENVEGMDGVYINCKYSEGELVEIQNFVLSDVDMNKLDAAYTEAGGNKPEYQAGQDIDVVERNMNASGYKCVRSK